jgi:hypothetical protein
MGLVAAGCAFDTSGVGSSGATVGEASTTTSPTDPGTGSTHAGEQPSTSTSITTNAADSSSGEPGGAAVLVLGDAPAFDFPDSALGEVETHGFVLRNQGTVVATSLSASVDATPFSLSGGSYPGLGGTCKDTLAPDDSCVIVLACKPEQWGPVSGMLSVTYDDPILGPGSAVTSLGVRGIGRSDNLLDNGDAEQGGSPPVGWAETSDGGSDWQVSGINPASGSSAIYAGEGSDVTTFRLRQAVDVEPWVALIDAGELKFRVTGQTRAYEQGNDPHEIRLRFFDAADAMLLEVSSGSYDGGTWNAADAEAIAPAQTRLVQVQLRCARAGGDFCDGYFDEVSLVAIYE